MKTQGSQFVLECSSCRLPLSKPAAEVTGVTQPFYPPAPGSFWAGDYGHAGQEHAGVHFHDFRGVKGLDLYDTGISGTASCPCGKELGYVSGDDESDAVAFLRADGVTRVALPKVLHFAKRKPCRVESQFHAWLRDYLRVEDASQWDLSTLVLQAEQMTAPGFHGDALVIWHQSEASREAGVNVDGVDAMVSDLSQRLRLELN